jgi:histidine triad (HIT) family protein
MNTTGKTLFETIITREVPAEIVYEDEYTIAFLDIHPTNTGHTLVVPKKVSRNALTIEKEDWRHLMEAVHYLAPKIQQAVSADGINIIANCEPEAGQIIFHTHIHIVPRFSGDGFQHWHGTPYPDGKMAQVAERVRKNISQI